MQTLIDLRARRSRAMPSTTVAILALSLSVSGCRSYERRSIDLAAHRDAFLTGATIPDEAAAALTSAESESRVGVTAAEEVALLLNPQLRLARWQAGVARASADNAGLWDDPTIGIDLSKLLEGPSQGWEVLGSVGLTIPLSGRLSLERDAAQSLTEVERARIAALEWETRSAVREAYFTWCGAYAACVEERAFSERLARILTLVETLAARGELARVEARLFQIEEVEAAGKLAELEAAVARARVELLRVIGLAPTAKVEFDPSAFASEEKSHDAQAADAGSVAESAPVEHFGRHPSIALAEAEYEAAERALALEVAKQYPDLQIGPGYGEQDGDRQFVLGLGIALPILNANRQGIAESEAQREVARVAAEIAVESLVAARSAAEIDLAAARARRVVLVEGVLPLVEAQAGELRHLAELGGEVDALILLDSLKRGRDARLAIVEATRELRLAESRATTLRGPLANNPSASDGRVEVKP
jgi:cobalt-zinc-cadmium efflux system outer membrane protein